MGYAQIPIVLIPKNFKNLSNVYIFDTNAINISLFIQNPI